MSAPQQRTRFDLEHEQAKLDLQRARAELDRLRANAQAARARSESVTPGGLRGYDPAVLSGVARSSRAGARSRERRFDAYDREAAIAQAIQQQEARVATLERAVKRTERDASAPRDLDAVTKGSLIRTASGWHRVVRVNAKSFTVETGYPWTDRIARDRVIETHISPLEN